MEIIRKRKIIGFINNNKIFLIIILIVIILPFLNSTFLTYENIVNILFQIVLTGIVAIGMTFIIISGDFDLSVGFNMSLAAAIMIAFERFGVIVAIILALITSTVVGGINGLLVAKLKINAFITTLAMMIFLKGWILLLTNNKTIKAQSNIFVEFGYRTILKIPYPAIIFLALCVILGLALSKTIWGRNIYAVGDNPEAASVFGINVDKIKISVFAITGFLCGISGFLLVTRINTASITYGGTMAIDAIIAVLLGGTSLSGGEGNMFKTFQGVLLLGVLGNAMVLLGITPYTQQLIKGLILILVVSIDAFYIKLNQYRGGEYFSFLSRETHKR